MKRRYQIFVSSTYKDLIEHRQLIIKSLMQVNAIPAGMELFPAADDDAWSLIQRTIEESDYYVVLIGGRYGSTDTNGLSFTENEYDYASQKGLPIMAFLHGAPATLPRDQTETDEKAWQMLQNFRAKAQKRHCKHWSNQTDLIAAVMTSYHHLIDAHPAVGWVRGNQAKTVEDLEKVVALQDKVKQLETELAAIRSEDSLLSNLPKDDQVMTFSIKCEEVIHSVNVPWRDVWQVIGNCAADLLSIETAAELFDQMVIEHYRFDGMPAIGSEEWRAWETSAKISVDSQQWQELRRLLTALNLIEVDTRQVQRHAGYDFRTHTQNYQTVTEYFCRLAPLGRKLLAKLLRPPVAEAQPMPAAQGTLP